MKWLTAIKYYTNSLPVLLRETNYWTLPLIFIKKPQLLKLKNRFTFYINSLMDAWTVKEVVIDDCYECYGQKCENIIDIGSGVGDFDVMMSNTSSRIFSFDASENRVKLLKKNLQLNNINNVIFENKFVISLNYVFEKYKISGCDLLKIDCEGAEYEIFHNTSSTNLKKINRIVGEIHLFDEKMKNEFIKLKHRLVTDGFSIKECENPVHNNILFFEASLRKT